MEKTVKKPIKIPKQRFRIHPTRVHTPKPKKRPKYKEREQEYEIDDDYVCMIEYYYD